MKPPDSPPVRKPRRSWFSFSLRSLLVVTTLICVGIAIKQQYDWRRKRELIHKWIAPLVEAARAANGDVRKHQDPERGATKPAEITPEEELAVLTFGILESETSEERLAALEVLIESFPDAAFAVIREVLPKSPRDPELQALLLRLLALCAYPDDVPRIALYLDDPAAELRAAAAEAISLIHEPGFVTGGRPFGLEGYARSKTLPPIQLWRLGPAPGPIREASRYNLSDDVFIRARERIESMMLDGPTELERTAAARALVTWPPESYSLRVAEWGVWLDNSGKLDLLKSILAENPPFVHGAGNLLGTLPRNRPQNSILVVPVTKPIVHLTADRPLAVDLEVAIWKGRPWYVYPRPDAFTVHAPRSGQHAFERNDEEHPISKEWRQIEPSGELPAIDDLREGYPWLHPEDQARGAPVRAVGFRWQSLIVSPERTEWQIPPDVPADSRYRWWQALREVPSSWVTSRDETERFLYYDGPSTALTPLAVDWYRGESRLVIQARIPESTDLSDDPTPTIADIEPSDYRRDLLLVDATQAPPRACALHPVIYYGGKESIPLDKETWLTADAIEASFRELLLERGLTEKEAEGLLIAWRERFFHNPGRRLISLLTPEEYDRLCPLKIRPDATEIVRVGMVLLEF